MKIKYLILGTLLLGSMKLNAQSTNGAGTNNNYNASWYLGWNNTNGTNPLLFKTNNFNRMKLNGNLSYNISSFAGTRNGFLLLGYNQGFASTFFANSGAFSVLHLNGEDGTFVQDAGYRPFMRTGITFTDNNDLSYFGLRKVGTVTDVTETLISWSDNAGEDDMVFRFTGINTGNTAISVSDLMTSTDLDGLHVARFSGEGNFGLGNTFGRNTTGTPINLYVSPQSLSHLSLSNFRSVWQQFTNRSLAVGTGTGENSSDGLRIGIIGNSNLNINGTAALYNQENRHLLFSTNANTNSANVSTGATLERLRITSVGAPTNLNPSGYGTYNPGGLGTNLTRVSISHNPSSPVTRPMSLLHLGYNTGLTSIPAGSTDGWRNWMDIGTFTSNGTDNMYVGLKDEGTDRLDAVISWGDNQAGSIISNQGPDNMRFIFTSSTSSIIVPGDPISQSVNGLETGRFYPGADTTFTYMLPGSNRLFGRFGVGNFSASGVNQNPTHKLDVIGNGRFRYLPDSLYMADSTVNKIVMVDSMGVLRWASYVPSQFGVSCSDTINGKLPFDSKIDLNNHNFYFTKNDSLGQNHVGIGYRCGDNLLAKLSVKQWHPENPNISTIAISGINSDTTSITNTTYTGVEGITNGNQHFNKVINRGGYFSALNSPDVRGVVIDLPSSALNTSKSIGGEFIVSTTANNNIGVSIHTSGNTSGVNYGVQSTAVNSSTQNLAGQFTASSSLYPNAVSYGITSGAGGSNISNVGGYFNVTSNNVATNAAIVALGATLLTPTFPSSVVMGIYANSNPSNNGLPGYAGYFDGNVFINGPANGTGFALTTSDAQFKTDINTIYKADSILNLLAPKSFYYDTTNNYGINFDNKKQYGLIAQEVEPILPELIINQHKPAMVDSLGNVVISSVDYKSLNYGAFTGILIKGHQEQKIEIDNMKSEIISKDSLINDLNVRLTNLENCLSGILPFLCRLSHSEIESNSTEKQQELISELNIILSNKNAIILNQNVPNPFAEKTVISYSIPESIGRAQIHFYDAKGNLIQSIDVIERGAGQLNVFGTDLSSGMYSYTLVADGKVVDTKRMVKE